MSTSAAQLLPQVTQLQPPPSSQLHPRLLSSAGRACIACKAVACREMPKPTPCSCLPIRGERDLAGSLLPERSRARLQVGSDGERCPETRSLFLPSRMEEGGRRRLPCAGWMGGHEPGGWGVPLLPEARLRGSACLVPARVWMCVPKATAASLH